MRSAAAWLLCIALAACESSEPIQRPRSPEPELQALATYPSVELKRDSLSARIVVLPEEKHVTVSYLHDSADGETYVARTEHDCASSTSKVIYLAIFDSSMTLLDATESEIEVEPEEGSLGADELMLACSETST